MNDNLACITSSHSREPRIGVRGRRGNPGAYAFKKEDVTPFSSRLTVANQNGFTLLEIIVSIVVMSIIVVIAGVGFIEIAKGYTFSRKNAVTTQQGQIAMARLKKEISSIRSITASAATYITFVRSSGGPPVTIIWHGGNNHLLIDGDTLVGPVALFNLTYYYYNPASSGFSSSSSCSNTTSIIEITLQLVAAEGTIINITDRVNLYQETGG